MKQNLKKGMAVVTMAALLGTGVTGCGMPGAGGMRGGNMGNMGAYGAMMGQGAEASVLTVDIEKPVIGNIYRLTELIGTVEPASSTSIFPKGSGTVTGVFFQVGDYVSAGQKLVTLDSDGLNSAAISLESAQMQLENATRDLERNRVLYENDGITRQALENSENSVKSAELQLRSAQNNYNNQAKNTTITATISGVVESRDVDLYGNVSAQKAVCTISDKSSMRVKFEVSERVKQILEPGQTLVAMKNGNRYSGTITEVAGKTTDNTGLFQVKANLTNSETLSTGSKVTVELVTDKTENAVIIPLDAIYYDNGKPYVFIRKDGMAEIVYVETGIYDDTNIEILSGLDIDTEVITSWSSQLTNGTRVQSVEEARAQRENAAAMGSGAGVMPGQPGAAQGNAPQGAAQQPQKEQSGEATQQPAENPQPADAEQESADKTDTESSTVTEESGAGK